MRNRLGNEFFSLQRVTAHKAGFRAKRALKNKRERAKSNESFVFVLVAPQSMSVGKVVTFEVILLLVGHHGKLLFMIAYIRAVESGTGTNC